MVFTPPEWVPALEAPIPDSLRVGNFVLNNPFHVFAHIDSPVLACASSGKTYTADEIKQKVESLSRALSQELEWLPNEGNPWDKVLGIYISTRQVLCLW